MTVRYARGSRALGECARSGIKMLRRNMVEDGQFPGLLVHPRWKEDKHPQETPPDVDDPIAIYRPAPEQSVPEDEGEAAPELEFDDLGLI